MLDTRAAFMTTGLRMIASVPAFGVGIGRYFETSGRFMPQSIYWFYFHENAHNNFLQIAGELGLVGLAGFVWLIGATFLRLARGVRASPNDRLLVGAIAGLGAFVATWLSGHPMLVSEVAFPFWILLGAATARADGDSEPPAVSTAPVVVRPPSRWPVRVAVGIALLVVAASVPIRARRATAGLDLAQQSFGFYDWEGSLGSGRYRWTSRSATFFVPPHAREVDVPLRAMHVPGAPPLTEVTIAIGGKVLHKVELTDGDWTTIRLRLPRGQRDEYRRLDLITDPTWTPAAVQGTHDLRVLGVQMGEPIAR